ncbi:MAG: hypothetical protein U0736_22950 [Gemmataceae bacterium]
MIRLLQWTLRPTVLVTVSVLLVAAAAALVVPVWNGAVRPQPLAVRGNEQEVAWLYPATSSANWERLAKAVQQAADRLQEAFPGLEVEQNAAGSLPASAVPEIALRFPADPAGRTTVGRRLVIRWYKITSQGTAAAWMDALLARTPPPLAIVGGNSSYWARQLALELRLQADRLPAEQRPVLLLTTATADRVAAGEPVDPPDDRPPGRGGEEADGVLLTDLYPDRTFRFCFSNRQMASAVTRFLWSRPELRPDADPAYLVQWTDDSYSQDLFAGYMRVLDYRGSENVLQQWGWVSGAVGLGLPAPALAGWQTSGFRHEAAVRLDVDSSVGSFLSPNPYEAKVVRDLLSQYRGERGQPTRPLLVVTGHSQPARRLLRDLARSAPDLARRFVVAMGDDPSFNTIYRDRQVTWPIQDLPFTVTLFCHRNPIDPDAGFVAPESGMGPGRGAVLSAAARRPAGTEDLLLYRDIIEATALAFAGGDAPAATADELAAGLRAVRERDGRLRRDGEGTPLFGGGGQRASGTGEYIVLLQPRVEHDRVLPLAEITVWRRRADRTWEACGPAITALYDEFEVTDVNRTGAPVRTPPMPRRRPRPGGGCGSTVARCWHPSSSGCCSWASWSRRPPAG